MALVVVEDGTGLSAADSYLSAADADLYFEEYGNGADWLAADDDNKEAALRRATQYIDSKFTFLGSKLSADQALEFPRVNLLGFTTSNQMPWPIKELSQATAELAIRALSQDLMADQDTASIKRESVGPIAVTYFGGNEGQTVYTLASSLLKKFRAGGGLSIRLERGA